MEEVLNPPLVVSWSFLSRNSKFKIYSTKHVALFYLFQLVKTWEVPLDFTEELAQLIQ